MSEFPKIAIINTGWSEDYRGAEVQGNFGYLDTGVGHERFNFLPAFDGMYYRYAPPLGEMKNPPMPADPEGWLVFFVSKRPGRTGLYLVGWYEDAAFARGYEPRPDADALGKDSDGGLYGYTVSASTAVAVPLPLRTMKVLGHNLKRSYAYLRGGANDDPWRQKMADELLAFRRDYLARTEEQELDSEKPRLVFAGNPERRREIEEAAVRMVIEQHPDWDCQSKEAEKCGYDLLLTHRTTEEIWHVEVKGTSLDTPCFFMTEKERAYAESLSPNDRKSRRTRDGDWRPLWKLAVVYSALQNPSLEMYSFKEMEKNFDMAPYAWRGNFKDPA